ncbi:MAG: glycine--tRNA ligase [Patescibacteria group bacterium]|nr:glycine--tRNA ligase [Patescibacteria group bacterium]MDE1945810.1 glycine--tRNA ligase [Patescibacteria group bacterium]
MAKQAENKRMEEIISLSKRRGFIYQGSEIYGGLAGTWDYGPLGIALKNNIRNLWWKTFVTDREDMYGVDAAILMNQNVWKASGHVATFSDPLVECKKCKKRFRADQVENPKKCPECGGELGEARQFNMMFKTNVGPVESEESVSYLRPETAQGMFVNYKNVVDSFHPKLPFGLAQIGKAFRNEIAPRDFTFRSREFEQMEIEYFLKGDDWKKIFEYWRAEMWKWMTETLGLSKDHIHELEVPAEKLAHYSKRTIDFEYDFPFGKNELYGLAYRTDFDLKNHSKASGVTLEYLDEEAKTKFTPHCVEPTFGVDRSILAVICEAYQEDELGGEKRVFMKFKPALAPVKIAVFPLLKNKPELVKKAREVYAALKKEFGAVMFDDNGNIGKRYRRQDEIGTPYCVTVDFETIEKDNCVTVRDRDSGKQERVNIGELSNRFKKIF